MAGNFVEYFDGFVFLGLRTSQNDLRAQDPKWPFSEENVGTSPSFGIRCKNTQIAQNYFIWPILLIIDPARAKLQVKKFRFQGGSIDARACAKTSS